MDKDVRKPTAHNMKRRSHSHDYSRSGYYHITISTTKALHQPLGQIAGRLDKPDGDSDAPHVVLSPLGQMVEQELRESIQRHYPMLEVMDYVVMPEHLHFLLVAHRDIVSNGGKPTHLGQVIAGFKYGCNKRYWAMTGRAKPGSTAPTGTAAAPEATPPAAEPPGTRGSVLGDSVAKSDAAAKPGVAGKLDAPPLFDAGYCDVMPIDEAQLATQRAYIRAAGLHPRQSAQPPAQNDEPPMAAATAPYRQYRREHPGAKGLFAARMSSTDGARRLRRDHPAAVARGWLRGLRQLWKRGIAAQEVTPRRLSPQGRRPV